MSVLCHLSVSMCVYVYVCACVWLCVYACICMCVGDSVADCGCDGDLQYTVAQWVERKQMGTQC